MSLVLNVEILGEFKKLTQATQGAANDLNGMSKRAASVSKSINRAFAAIGIGLSFKVLANELGEATKAAVDDLKSQQLLANQLINTTGATEKQIAAVEKNIKALQLQTSIADDDLRPAMAQLTRATGSTSEATRLLTLATDISAQTGKDLTTVSLGLSKAYNGQFGALSKLGIPMTDSIQNAQLYSAEMKKLTKLQGDANFALETYGIKSKEYVAAQEKVATQQEKVNGIAQAGIDWQNQLGEAFAGAADKAAQTDPYQRMRIIFGELQETVGMALLPTLEKFATWVASPEGQQKLEDFIGLITGLAGKFEILAGWAIDNADAIVAWSGVIAGAGLALKVFTTGVSVYNGVASIMAARNAAVAASNVAVGTTATTAAGGVGILSGALKGLAAAGAIAAGVALVDYAQTSNEPVKDILKQRGDMIPSPDVIAGKQKTSTSTTNITINTPKVTAQEITNLVNKAKKNGYTGIITIPRSK